MILPIGSWSLRVVKVHLRDIAARLVSVWALFTPADHPNTEHNLGEPTQDCLHCSDRPT